jgi:hypothetical protein
MTGERFYFSLEMDVKGNIVHLRSAQLSIALVSVQAGGLYSFGPFGEENLKPLCRPSGACLASPTHPGLTPWAKLFRASGAGILAVGVCFAYLAGLVIGDRKGFRMNERGKPSSSRGRSAGMTMNKTTGMVLVVIILVIGTLLVVWMYRPRRTEALGTINCSDGPRLLVDAGKFDTQYWAYSIKLEGTLNDKGKLRPRLSRSSFSSFPRPCNKRTSSASGW